MLGFVMPASFGQTPRPSVYLDPEGPLEPYLTAAMTHRKVPVELVTDRARATYLLTTSRITTGKSNVGIGLHYDEITVAGITVVLSGSASNLVAWSDVLSEPTHGNKTERALADMVAKRLKKFIEKNHGDLAAGEKPERSHSIAAVVGSLFGH